MAWGKSKAQAPPPSMFSQLLPLLITVVVLAVAAWVGYIIYLSVLKIQTQAQQQMGSKNVVWTKDGVKVGVRHFENERYVDATQSWVVKAWNLRGGGGKNKDKGQEGDAKGSTGGDSGAKAFKRLQKH